MMLKLYLKQKRERYTKAKSAYNRAIRTPELNRQMEEIARKGMSKETAQGIIDQIEAVPYQKRTANLKNKLVVAKRLVNGAIKPNDALSGMSNEEADVILDKYKDDPKVEKIGA